MEDKKFCKFCGEKIDKDAVVCPKCGRQVGQAEEKKETTSDVNVSKNTNPKFYEQTWFMWVMLVICAPIGIFFMWKFHPEIEKKTKTILTVIFAILFIIFIAAGNSNDESSFNNNQTTNNGFSNTTNNNKKKNIALDEKFTFDDLEISLGTDFSFTTINNQYSDYNGKEIIKMPITVKNLKDETHGLNMFYYSVYGSNGTKLDTPSSYFDDSVDFAGDLRTGASYTKYLYFLYDGNGTYTVEFDNWITKRIVEFEVNK
jgi:uncharacterized membrane protein YvbJ